MSCHRYIDYRANSALCRHILRDPLDYPDPEKFFPDRYMKDGALNPDVRDPTTIAFGLGRRYVLRHVRTQCCAYPTIVFVQEGIQPETRRHYIFDHRVGVACLRYSSGLG